MTFLTLTTASGELHGMVGELANDCKEDAYEKIDKKIRAEAEKLRKEDAKTVKARYINHMGAHERLDKAYCRWAGDRIQKWHLIPNHVYELPMGFVKEVNASGLVERSKLEESGGASAKQVDGREMRKQRIHELVPISF